MSRSIVVLFMMWFGVVGLASAEKGDQYWMAKAGMSYFEKQEKPDPMSAFNVTYGYGLTKAIAAEIDYQQSVGGGRYSDDSNSQTGKFSYYLVSVGAAYRYVFYERLYFRGKVAAAFGDESVKRSDTNTTETKEAFNGSVGLALGLLAGDLVGSSLTLELEYIKQSEFLSSILLGANLTF